MNFIAFDLETTGVKPSENMIVEVGAVLFDGDRALKGFGTLVDPGIPIPPDASAVNGISDEMVRGKPRIADVLAEFAGFCGDLPVVAHNAPFDFKFLLEDIKLHRATPQRNRGSNGQVPSEVWCRDEWAGREAASTGGGGGGPGHRQPLPLHRSPGRGG